MFKNLMNGVSLSSLMLRDADNENGSPDPKEKLRAELAKGNVQNGEQNADGEQDNEGDGEGDEESEEDDDEEDEEKEGEVDDTVKDPPEDETEDQKKAREAAEKEAAKAQRKQDRVQRRIDKLVKARETAEAEVARLKAQLEANPDQKLTAEEIEAKAEALAAKKAKDKELADLQTKFDKDCDTLQKAAKKVDREFDNKIHELAEDIGPIPSFMIGILANMDNGGEVLAHVANDDELAEEVWTANPAKMTRMLVEIQIKLEAAKKPPKKQISKVPDPGTPVKGVRVASNTLTEADAKNMEVYVAKRQKQMAEKRKAQGFN